MAPDRRGLARVASSIRFRITAIATVVVAAVLVAAGVGLAAWALDIKGVKAIEAMNASAMATYSFFEQGTNSP